MYIVWDPRSTVYFTLGMHFEATKQPLSCSIGSSKMQTTLSGAVFATELTCLVIFNCFERRKLSKTLYYLDTKAQHTNCFNPN